MAYRTKTYTLREETAEGGARYFISFKDGQGRHHELEVSHAFYLEFRRLELDNRKLQNWDWRHREFNEVWEDTLRRRALRLPKSLDELLLDAERDELLYRTIDAFPETQKSWLMLKLCLCVSQGLSLWEMPTTQGDVLYLCLEDTFSRIQDRLFQVTDEASGRLHFAVASCKLTDGLIVQLEDYLKDYPDSKMIVIDTLQKVRTASKDNAYASDYGDISLLKDFADRHSLAVIVVHHIRKQKDSDVFNMVSGTTGLTGSADTTFVLENSLYTFVL